MFGQLKDAEDVVSHTGSRAGHVRPARGREAAVRRPHAAVRGPPAGREQVGSHRSTLRGTSRGPSRLYADLVADLAPHAREIRPQVAANLTANLSRDGVATGGDYRRWVRLRNSDPGESRRGTCSGTRT